jgi:hypothetical protein
MSRTARLIGTLALVGGTLVASSTPAQAQAGGPFQFNSLTPCRVFDTRATSAPNDPNMTNGVTLKNPGPSTWRIQGRCGVPVGARAVTLNVTITQPNVAGDVRMYPSNVALPLVSTLNYNAGEPALANGAIVPLAQTTGPDLAIVLGMAAAAGSGTIHVLVDVTGYFQ